MLYKCLPFQLDITRAAVRPCICQAFLIPRTLAYCEEHIHGGASSGCVWGDGAAESSSQNLCWMALGDLMSILALEEAAWM